MKISCVCGKIVGEILPGSKIRKGTAFLCYECNSKRIIHDTEKDQPIDGLDGLKGIFADAIPGADIKIHH